ncbi:LysR family transcriptional regulator [Kitasatospora sp. NPDC096147]|uniref:LysR family transcriptional regulator n=1 Tax=Kitasatospora sp. NPDC096147 TaxID=3364093 RepID=UPI003826F097
MLERLELEAFLTLAEELHFGRTAERLHVSTGRISQTIKKLERQVGAPLFERTSRDVRLTALGERLRADLGPAYEQIGAGLAQAIIAARGITGSLAVGYSALWCGDLVIRAAEVFRARYPDCEVRIEEAQLGDPFGPLRAGRLDLQLTEFPVREPDITVGPLVFSEPRALMVAADHPFAGRATVSLEDLADTVLLPMTGKIPDYWLEYHYPSRTPSGRPIPHGAPITYWQEVLAHISAGSGVSVVAARGASYYTRPGVVFVPFGDAPTIDYGLLWLTAAENARIRAFVNVIHELREQDDPTTR